jgi:hypothetical protein
MENLETVTVGNAILKCFKGVILEFDNLAALEADQVIMVALPLNRLILSFSIRKFPLGGQAKMGEKLECSIDCRIANFRIDLGHLGIDLSKVPVAGGIEKDTKNLFPLFGRLQPFARNPCLEKVCFNGRTLFEIEFQFHFNQICLICQRGQNMVDFLTKRRDR